MPRYLLVASEADPVATAVLEHWGTPPATGEHLDGTAIRALTPDAWLLRRPGRHVNDEGLDARLPRALREARVPLVFPSIHRSESGVPCYTVHPLGNLGDAAEVGGAPGRLTPTAPRLMTDALRRLREAGRSLGLPATYEATHHGPFLGQPAFFAEIGFGPAEGPTPEAVAALSKVLLALAEEPGDRVALGIGGGHYVPHLTDLALTRAWAFGHLVSRHALARASREQLESALALTPGAEGIVYARALDAEEPKLRDLAPRLRETAAPRRTAGTVGAA